MIDRTGRQVDVAELIVGGVLVVGVSFVGFCLTVLPWLIGIGWMANHWLGVGQ